MCKHNSLVTTCSDMVNAGKYRVDLSRHDVGFEKQNHGTVGRLFIPKDSHPNVIDSIARLNPRDQIDPEARLLNGFLKPFLARRMKLASVPVKASYDPRPR